jgi:hypothetical protein
MAPLVAHIDVQITPDDVAGALAAMHDSAPGPDGLRALLLTAANRPLPALLAPIFTRALSDMPAALREAETVLLAKGSTPPSSNPLRYRPITLIPVLVRLLHKVVDMRLRRLIFTPGADAAEPPLPTQAGFMPHRGTHEQATILHTLAAMGKSTTPVYCAFLDIQKAFDSIDHWHLLEVLRDRIRLPPVWCEVIRRILMDNHTTILGERVDVERGAFQGSPLSPLLCILFLEDLAADIKAHIDAFPQDFASVLPRRCHRHVALTLLLMYADDITLLAHSGPALQRLLDLVARWGLKRKVVFSDKSTVCLLRGNVRLHVHFPAFYMGSGSDGGPRGFLINRALGNQRYLGVPTRTYQPYARIHRDGLPRPFELDLPALRRLAGALASVFFAPGGLRIVSIPAWVQGINQVLLAKALYPTAVTDVDYAALDSIVLRSTTRLLGLPPGAPAALLRWELRLVPTELQGHCRALTFAHRFTAHSWFYRLVMAPLLAIEHHLLHDLSREERADQGFLTQLLGSGPIGRISSLLACYRASLFPELPAEPAPSFRALWLRLAAMASPTWHERARAAIDQAFQRWCEAKLQSYPAGFREYLTDGQVPHGDGLPRYLKIGGPLARVALRLKAPFLRIWPRDQPPPPCAWCPRGSEHWRHLMHCPALPPLLRYQLDTVRARIRQEARLGADPHGQLLQTCLLSFTWNHQSQDTLRALLLVASRILGAYRLAVPTGPGRFAIWPVPMAPPTIADA